MLVIKDINDLKITKIKGTVIHFKLYNKYYFVMNGSLENTLIVRLYEKTTRKTKSILLESRFGFIPDLIKYKYNNKIFNEFRNKNTPIKFIDIENFVNKLCDINFIEVEKGDDK